MGKVVCITGASSGFGEACVRLFADGGWRLVLVARREERLEQLKAELEDKIPVYTMVLDVRDREKVQKSFDTLPDDFKEIDVLVNNAGLALGLEPAHEAQLEDWDTMVDTNIKGLMFCTRAVLPGMVARDRGHIINIGSVAGDCPYPGGNVYGATKAFVKQFSRNLRVELASARVRVTCVEPGLAESEFSVVRFKGDREKAAKVYEGCEPLTPEDIGGIVFWAATLPLRVNINLVEVMPLCQTWGGFSIHRSALDKKSDQ
jgi:3-hydroxy acid dehydrogenase/malonic semialdehyde reductase